VPTLSWKQGTWDSVSALKVEKEGLRNPFEENSGDSVLKETCSRQFRTPHLAHMGRELRVLADEFSRSKERLCVQKKADEVDFSNVSKDDFFGLLEELFCGGISRMRIVVLFFFCSDVAIRALKNDVIAYFQRFVTWAFQYIADKICTWVAQHGGWEKVLSKSMDAIYKYCGAFTIAVVSVAVIIYIRKKLS